MKTYKLPKGELIRTVKAHESPVIVMTIDPTSTLIATGGAEGAVKVWDLVGGYVTHNFRGHAGMISALRFWGEKGSDKWLLASASDLDNKVKIWNLVERIGVASFENHDSVVRGLDFSIDGKILLSGGRDKIINAWDVIRQKHIITIPVMDTVETVGFLKPGVLTDDDSEQLIFAGGEKGETSIWSLKHLKRISLKSHRPYYTNEDVSIIEILYKPEPKLFVSVLSDQTLLQISLESIDLKIVKRIGGNHGEIIDSTFIGDDETYLAIATNSPEIRIIKKNNVGYSILSGHTDTVMALDRSVGGYWLATAGKDEQARLWDLRPILKDGRDVQANSYSVLSGNSGAITAIALPKASNVSLSSDGIEPVPKFVITGSFDLIVKRWSIPQKPGENASAVYSRKAHDKGINAIDVSPDNRMFATASHDRTAKIWNLETGDVIATLSGHKRGVWTVKFNHFEKLVATGSGDMTIKLWSLKDFSVLRTFQGHTNSVLKVAFLTHGIQLVSSGADYLIKVWDVKTGECNTTLDYHKEKVWSLAVPENDDNFVSGGSDGVVAFWKNVTEEKRLEEQNQAAELIMKQQQLDNYVNSKDWKNAIILALSLDHPLQVLKLFSKVIENNNETDSITGLVAVDRAIGDLGSDDLLIKLLLRIRDWNTNGRTSTVAQVVLHTIMCYYNIEKLCQLEGISKIVEGLIPYSEKHMTRVGELIEESYVVDYVLQLMEKVA